LLKDEPNIESPA